MIIQRVEIQGLEAISEGFVRGAIVKTRAGQTFSRARVESDVRELLRTRKFINVFANTSVEGGEAVVIFVVEEKPQLASVEFIGNQKLKDKDLITLAPSTGQPLDIYEVNRGRDEIIRKYRQAGYFYATVEVDAQVLERERRLVFQINEGPRVKVRKILFEGADSFSTRKLRSLVKTKTYVWVFRAGAFDNDQADRDGIELERFYRDEGFLDARAGYRLEFDEVDRSKLTVIFVIEEGPRYRIEEIAIDGNTAFTTETLLSEMKLAPGEFFRDEALQLDTRRLQDLYGEIGYVDARINTAYDFLEAPGVVRLRVEISESERFKFGRITVRGNLQTKDKVIRRELRFYPGEDYNTVKARKAERRLRETGLFSRATISPLPGEDGVREALVEIEESDSILFLIGAGVSTDSGLLGSITLENRNFDIGDWPRTFGELFRGQAFRGAGQRLRFTAEPGTDLTRFRIDFIEPYLLDRPLRLGTSVYLFQRGRATYDEERLGTTLSLGKRFETGPLDGWAVEGAVRLERVDITEVDALAARQIRAERGTHTLTSVKAMVVRDTTDSRFRPSEGYRFTLGWEQFGALGGEYTFSKPSASVTWYKTLRTDLLERKSVLGVRGDVAYIAGDAPMFEKYYGGGFGSVRGFQYRGISPRNGIRDDAIGGNFILLTGAEYSFPLYGRTIRGVTFIDMGTVEEDFELTDWRVSAGFGIRIDIDFFGPVPMIFDFGFPIAKSDDDDTQVFNFSMGASF